LWWPKLLEQSCGTFWLEKKNGACSNCVGWSFTAHLNIMEVKMKSLPNCKIGPNASIGLKYSVIAMRRRRRWQDRSLSGTLNKYREVHTVGPATGSSYFRGPRSFFLVKLSYF
jgi:hypothetical protein